MDFLLFNSSPSNIQRTGTYSVILPIRKWTFYYLILLQVTFNVQF